MRIVTPSNVTWTPCFETPGQTSLQKHREQKDPAMSRLVIKTKTNSSVSIFFFTRKCCFQPSSSIPPGVEHETSATHISRPQTTTPTGVCTYLLIPKCREVFHTILVRTREPGCEDDETQAETRKIRALSVAVDCQSLGAFAVSTRRINVKVVMGMIGVSSLTADPTFSVA